MKNTFKRTIALHRSPHFYIALGLSIYVPLRLLYILQPFLVYKRCPFIIDDPEIKLLSSVDNFDTYIINRNSDIDVVYLHGSRISARNHIKIAKQINHNVILPFYPGFCTSTGPMNEIEIKKCMLILADTLKKRGKKVKIFAQSLGTAVAYYLSTQIDYDRMVLENSFRDLKTVIKRRWYGIIYIIAYDRWSNHGIEDKKKITYLCSEFDNFVGKDYSFFGDNEKVILKDSSHFNAYRKVKNYAEVINNALNNK